MRYFTAQTAQRFLKWESQYYTQYTLLYTINPFVLMIKDIRQVTGHLCNRKKNLLREQYKLKSIYKDWSRRVKNKICSKGNKKEYKSSVPRIDNEKPAKKTRKTSSCEKKRAEKTDKRSARCGGAFWGCLFALCPIVPL